VPITVGMPTFNSSRTLRRAIDSILSQDFYDFQLLIGDNASTDETPRILREFEQRDARVTVHQHGRNIGAGKNFLWLAENAKSPYFVWVASDDYISTSWLRELLVNTKSSGNPTFGQLCQVDGEGQVVDVPASNRRMQFRHHRLVRQLKYLTEPAVLGRANLVYSVMLREDAIGIAQHLADGDHGDQVGLFKILRSRELASVPGVWLHKTLPIVISDLANTKPHVHWLRLVTTAIRGTFVNQLFKSANFGERVLIVLSAPIAISRTLVYFRKSAALRLMIFGKTIS